MTPTDGGSPGWRTPLTAFNANRAFENFGISGELSSFPNLLGFRELLMFGEVSRVLMAN